MKRKHIIKFVPLITIILVATLFGCRFFSMENEEQVSSDEGAYAIDSQTILQSLTNGDTQVFTSLTATPDATPQTNLPPVHWSQANYFQIAQAFNEMKWKESLDSWKFNDIFFRLDCDFVSLGPQFASFKIFKTIHTREEDSRLVHYIHIDPQQDRVSWGKTEYYPQVDNWSYLDLTKIKIPVEGALNIAENNGGQQARLAVNNNCNIFISMVAGLRDNDWQVWYSGNGSDKLFIIEIDEQSGEYQIIPTATTTE